MVSAVEQKQDGKYKNWKRREQGSQSHDEHSQSDLSASTGPSSDIRLFFTHGPLWTLSTPKSKQQASF